MIEITTKVEGEKAKSTVTILTDKVEIKAKQIHFSGFNKEEKEKEYKNVSDERIAVLEGKINALEVTVSHLHSKLANVRIGKKLDKILHLLEGEDLSISFERQEEGIPIEKLISQLLEQRIKSSSERL
ncbi:hypothetical protein ACWE42_25315 [Sutcliffiella cohnii]